MLCTDRENEDLPEPWGKIDAWKNDENKGLTEDGGGTCVETRVYSNMSANEGRY